MGHAGTLPALWSRRKDFVQGVVNFVVTFPRPFTSNAATTMKMMLALLLAATSLTLAQDTQKPAAPEKPKAAPAPVAAAKPAPTPEELEAKFITTMSKATMTGRWCLVQDGKLTPEREEKYTIVGARKLDGDSWMIGSKMNYGGREMIMPIPVKVKWAGDTPVITVDNLKIPGGGTYSARVLVYEHTYAGTWSGGDKVGLLSGMITNEKEEAVK
jgi:hypothetical protein